MDFAENLEMTHIVRGGGWGHVICVIMMHCVQKSISDSSQYFNTFVTIERVEPHNYD